MRRSLILSMVFLFPATLHAQQEEKPKYIIKVDKVRVGYRSASKEGTFKAGFWIPVYVDVSAGSKGAQVTKGSHYLEIRSNDSEGLPAYYRIPIPASFEPNEVRTFVAYTKPGTVDAGQNIEVALYWDDHEHKAPRPGGGPLLELYAHLYLTLGSNIPDLREALALLAQNQNQNIPGVPADLNFKETNPRFLVYENDVALLPEHWFGYQTVDLMILSTDRKDFLTALFADANKPKLAALAQWVRRGGRLVIPVNYQNQDLLAKILHNPVWQPTVPVVPPDNPGDVLKDAPARLPAVEEWASIRNKPFPGRGIKSVSIARLDPGGVAAGIWDVQAKTEDGRPLIAAMPYGLGRISYIAFSLEDAPFKQWDGRVEFLKKMVEEFAQRVNPRDREFVMRGNPMGDGNDLVTKIYNELEKFDVNVVPFGYVALFIILYILVVGPLDYLVLKYVFHRLEWTWITFPAVVIAVSVAAYFTAYALKGNDLKINKIDIVDFDLRTELDGKQQTARSFAYGQSYFTILSPRIQNYTVGVEPNPAFWGGKNKETLSADQVSWLGRSENEGFGAIGRSESRSFFRRPYSYADEAKGMRDVPIPVWTTRAFDATWEVALAKPPLHAELTYDTRDGTAKLSGTLKNNLGVDLEDVWIFFGDHGYPIPGRLKCTANGGGPLKISLEAASQRDIAQWVNETPREEALRRDADVRSAQNHYNPTPLIRQAMFLWKSRPNDPPRNHDMRQLDFSWRLQKDQGQAETRLREAILYAHVPFQRGQAEALTTGPSPMPTNLWLGELPTSGKPRPELAGILAQDTFVRVLMPVRRSLEN